MRPGVAAAFTRRHNDIWRDHGRDRIGVGHGRGRHEPGRQGRRGNRGGARHRPGLGRGAGAGRGRCGGRHRHRRAGERHPRFAPATHEELAGTGALVEAAGARWLPIQLDQRNIALLRQAAGTIEASFGGIDVLFANAGIQAFKPLLEMNHPDWHDQIDVNLTGTANVLRAFAPAIVRRGGGRIIITSSTQGQQGTKNGSAYAASKWGLIGLMKSVALELGTHKITVNALIPGLIDTKLTRHEDRYAAALAAGGQEPTGDVAKDEEAVRQAQLKKTPLSVPWIAPEDVAPMVVFLASDAARMVSGSVFEVTGGVSAQLTA